MNFFSKIKHFILYGLGSASQALSGILILPLLTKNLSIEAFGAYSMITLCGSMASSVFYLGITSALPRFYFDSHIIEERLKILSTATFIILLGAIVQTVLGFVLSGTLSYYLFNNYDYTVILALTFAGYAFLFLNQYILAYWRLVGLASRVLNWAIFNISLNFIGIYIGITYIEKSLYVPAIVFLFVQIFQFIFSVIQTKELISIKMEKVLAKSLTRFGTAAILTSMGTLAIDWFDRFVVNNYLTLKDVAVYSFAYKIGTLINIVLIIPFISVWNPIMMEHRTASNIKEIFKNSTLIYFILGCFCTIFATLFFQDIVFFFVPQKNYAEIVNYFPLIMFGTLIYGLSNVFSAGYLYNKKIFGLTKLYFAFAIINICMTFVFVKKWQLYGAVWSSFITYTMIPFGIYYLGARELFSFDYQARKLFSYSIFVLFIIWGGTRYLTESSLANIVIKLLIFAVFIVMVFGIEFKFKISNIKKLLSQAA